MVEFKITGKELWNRMERAVEKVNERLRKTVGILESAKVPYAVIGGHAVRAWVAQVDEAALRTTQGVDILVRPSDSRHDQRNDSRWLPPPHHNGAEHAC